jgi:UDP-2-acetamido-2,6-beta-L-arabino-hexul-4-ose reductase
MRVLVTGSQGFIGKNLVVRLGEQQGFVVQRFDRGDESSSLDGLLARADAVVHLAGVNRPRDAAEFSVGNAELTSVLCAAMERSGRSIPLIYTSSCQAEGDTPYARSKRAAEVAIENMVGKTGGPAVIYRLPNVFGKWCRPNYNSVVATFCHNLANDQPIKSHDPAAPLTLAYIDDVVDEFIEALRAPEPGLRWGQVAPQYSLTVGELASQIEAFRNCRTSLQLERVGSGLTRALYATFISYLPTSRFSHPLPENRDPRGTFVEMLKTRDSGQFSFFTAHAGVTRGGHYHHTKTEKFLVLKGKASFKFRNILTQEFHELVTDGSRPEIVETIPGWAHAITNIGNEDMIVMLWANEIFDRERPDTYESRF